MTPACGVPRTEQIRQLARLRLFYLKNLEESANSMADLDKQIAILESHEADVMKMTHEEYQKSTKRAQEPGIPAGDVPAGDVPAGDVSMDGTDPDNQRQQERP